MLSFKLEFSSKHGSAHALIENLQLRTEHLKLSQTETPPGILKTDGARDAVRRYLAFKLPTEIDLPPTFNKFLNSDRPFVSLVTG